MFAAFIGCLRPKRLVDVTKVIGTTPDFLTCLPRRIDQNREPILVEIIFGHSLNKGGLSSATLPNGELGYTPQGLYNVDGGQAAQHRQDFQHGEPAMHRGARAKRRPAEGA